MQRYQMFSCLESLILDEWLIFKRTLLHSQEMQTALRAGA